MTSKPNPWITWIEEQKKANPTSQFTAIQARVYTDRMRWIRDLLTWTRLDTKELLELWALRISAACLLMVLLTLAELLGPVPYLECQALTDTEEIRCEYRLEFR